MSSQHNELAQYPELLKSFVVATGLKETEEGVLRLGETLQPVISIWDKPEWALIRGELPVARRMFVAAGGAGTLAGSAVCNPAGSGIVIVVVSVSASVGAYSLAAYTDAAWAAAYGNTTTGYPRDRRRQALASQGLIRYGNTQVGVLAGGLEHELRNSAAGTTQDFRNLPQMLYAGHALACYTNGAAAAADVNWAWYERKCVTNEARGGA